MGNLYFQPFIIAVYPRSTNGILNLEDDFIDNSSTDNITYMELTSRSP